MEYVNRSLHIRQIAADLLKQYNINNRFEIDILSLISDLDQDITYQFADLKGLAGFSCHDRKSDRYGIFFDLTTHNFYPTRTKFTGAHELGHIVLGHFKRVHINSAFFSDHILETEANLFADELLMPTKPIIDLHMSAMDIISVYRVSTAAALNKLRFIEQNSIFLKHKATEDIAQFIIDPKYLSDLVSINVNQFRENLLDPDYEFSF